MTIDSTLILITVDPSHPLAMHAYRYVKTILEIGNKQCIEIFFYADAAHTANQLRWEVADRKNLTTLWQQLANNYQLSLPVCVSTAITRGITDTDNAERHQLGNANIAPNFKLVGLSELATKLNSVKKIIQF